MSDVNAGYWQFIAGITGARSRAGAAVSRVLRGWRILALPVVVLYLLVLIVVLKLKHGRRPVHGLHFAAMCYSALFWRQYPLHLYPAILKSMELAFARVWIQHGEHLELAIGDGSMSSMVHGSGGEVVGLDLNPYSLRQAAARDHVSRAIVADCTRPPVQSAEFLLALNLLHHVTNKEQCLEAWSRVAPVAVWNENTTQWSRGWVQPMLLEAAGCHSWAARWRRSFEQRQLQSLVDLETCDFQAARSYLIHDRTAALSVRTMRLATVTSWLMGCYGPPTPECVKWLCTRTPFARVASWLTGWAAFWLIAYDSTRPESESVLVCYLGESRACKAWQPGPVVMDGEPLYVADGMEFYTRVPYLSDAGLEYGEEHL